MSEENKNTETPPQAPLPQHVVEGLENLIEGKADGDKDNALRLLYNDNKNLRESNRQLKDNQPAEDAEVLTGEEAKRYRSIEAPDGSTALETLQSQVEDREAVQKQLAEYERKEEDRRVAKAEGITDLDAFRDLRNGEVFSFRKEENDDGETVERAYVAPDEDTDPIRVREYDRFKRFENTLWSESEAEEPHRPSVPNQRPGGNAPSDEKSDAEIKSEQKKRHRFSI